MLDSALQRQPALTRFLCHIYQRLEQGHLNLVTGAGISIDAGVPNWYGLLERLTEHSKELTGDFNVHRSAGLSPEYLGQIIYHRHRGSNGGVQDCGAEGEATINHGWAQSIHSAIYKNVPSDIDEVLRKHPYLTSLRNLARKVPFVINFNFDDILAQAVLQKSDDAETGNSYSVEWNPPLRDRKQHTTIYHVNGLLPQISLRKRSPQLIFTEDSFADAMARAPGVSAEYIFMRFVQNTMLIVGHSLGDASLKSYLRQNRDKAPANHHYMIYWIRDATSLSNEQQNDIFDANLELYNLFTIFLTSSEMTEFFTLLNMNKRDFRDILDNMGGDRRSCYRYYIVGPVASGKSSLLEHLRCFATFEEWTQPPPQEMYLSFDKLDAVQTEKVDSFVYKELKEKNDRIGVQRIGFYFMDRAPLDLYAFCKDDEERRAKTQRLDDVIIRHSLLHDGQIIFLKAKGETLVNRNYGRGRPPEQAGTAEYLDGQTNSLQKIYSPAFVFDTENESAGQIAKKVVRRIFLKNYEPTNLNRIMGEYR